MACIKPLRESDESTFWFNVKKAAVQTNHGLMIFFD